MTLDLDDTPVCNEHLRLLMDSFDANDERQEDIPKIETNLSKAASHFKKFHYWELLPAEIRIMIAKETDFVTRFALMYTSKSNYEVARSSPILVKSIDIRDIIEGAIYLITIFRSEGQDPDPVFLFYTDNGGDAKISRASNEIDQKIFILEGVHFLTEMKRCIENLLKLADYRVDDFKCVIDGVENFGEDSLFIDKLKVQKRLTLTNLSDEITLVRWLNTSVKNPLDRLTICMSKEIDADCYVDHEAIENARNLQITHPSIGDSHLLDLENGEIEIFSDNNITNRGINKFIRRWINGKGPESFKWAHISQKKVNYAVLKGIDYVRWDENFEDENPVLDEWISARLSRHRIYYIESEKRNNGALLVIEPGKVVFLVTGKRC